MQTVIVRFLKSESDILGEWDEDIPATPEVRKKVYENLDAEFTETSQEVANFLAEAHFRTQDSFGWAFDMHARGELDILSSEPGIDSGVVEYQRLLPSRAYAVTATEDVIHKLLELKQVEWIHPNYVYEIPYPELEEARAR